MKTDCKKGFYSEKCFGQQLLGDQQHFLRTLVIIEHGEILMDVTWLY